METGEAIMGVTKILMASNDTLFNFEDTLGDRDDMFSPRTPHSGANTCTATTPQPVECITPTNDPNCQEPSAAINIESNMQNMNSSTAVRPTLKPFDFENAIDADELPSTLPNDMLSPEQAKTFSEEINSIEQSSDLSGTIDATTNTLDDLKTCISVHLKNDDEDDDGNNDEELSDWAESSVSLNQHESVKTEHNKPEAKAADTVTVQSPEDPKIPSSSDSPRSQDIANEETPKSTQVMYPSSPSISTTYSASSSPTSSPSPSICDKSPSEKETDNDQCNGNCSTFNTHHNGNDDKYNGDFSYKENTVNFLTKEIEYASSQNCLVKNSSESRDYYKENKDPNAKQISVGKKYMTDGNESSGTKVQNNSQATVILNADVLNEPEVTRRLAEPQFVSVTL